jgi:hypothetical protein
MQKAASMKTVRMLVLFLAPLLVLHTRALAWNATGHMVRCRVGLPSTPPDLKAKVTDLLRSHPNFMTWEQDFPNDVTSLYLETYLFIRAALWLDEIKHTGNEFDHPEWHFINYPSLMIRHQLLITTSCLPFSSARTFWKMTAPSRGSRQCF